MPVVLEQFVRNLRESRLLSPEEAASLEKAISASKTPRTAEDVARLLVQNGKLTQFQAAAISQGRQQSLILGEYILLDVLGKGGMGVVFRAKHRLMDRVVALKTLAIGKIKPDSEQRFDREVRAAARLSHRNIVTAFDAGDHHGTHYLVTEYVIGRDLSAIVKEKGPLSLRDAIDYARQAAGGLDFAHNHGVVHRDVKPGNLLLDRDGVVKILDMGLARLNENLADSPEAAELTGTGQILGTVDYMSPEQAVDVRSADQLSDIYSLGCTLYFFLTRRPVYTGENIVQRILAHRDNPVPSVMEIRPDCPPALDALIRRMLAKRPQDRPQSMAEIMGELDNCLASPGTAPPPVGAAPARPAPSPSSWLEDLVSDAAHATDDSQIHDATVAAHAADVLHAPPPVPGTGGSITRHSGVSRRAKKKTVATARRGKRWMIVAGFTVMAIAAAGAIFAVVKRGGLGAQGAESSLPAEPPMGPAVLPDEAKHAESAASGKPAPAPRSAWEEAWAAAKARADRLAAAHSYEKAIHEYAALTGRFKDPPAEQRIKDAILRIELQADAAYAEVEKNAARHLHQGQYLMARRILQQALTAYGAVSGAGRAKKLLDEIDAAEKKAAPAEKRVQPAQRPAPPVISPELLKKRRDDKTYSDAMQDAEDRAAAWDFAGASDAAASAHFDSRELTTRADRRRGEIKRMADLKDRMIKELGQANPRLQKSDLGLLGLNAEITQADAAGITATLDTGKQETIPWTEIRDKGLNLLLSRVVHPQDAGDCLAAGLMALQVRDASTAEKYFEQARSLKVETAPYREKLAAAEFAAVRDLLAKHKHEEADSRLAALAEKYGTLPWFAENKPEIDAAAKEAKRGLREKDAKALYARAAALYREGSLPELKQLVDRFQAQFADSDVAADRDRRPSMAEIEKAVADLGPVLQVRKDGRGDAASIQEAVNKAARGSVIQIEENGPWNEQIVVPAEKDNLLICGKKGLLPVLTTSGSPVGRVVTLEVRAPRLSLQGLEFACDGEKARLWQAIGAVHSSVAARGLVVHGHVNVDKLDARQSVFAAGAHAQTSIVAKDCVFFEQTGAFWSCALDNVLIIGGANCGAGSQLRHSTITGYLQLKGKITDSIVFSISAEEDGQTIEYCDVYGNVPYLKNAKPGKGCLSARPLFVDPKDYDFRLQPQSPCRSAASDGSDLGFSPPRELQPLIRIATELRDRARK